MDGELDFPNNTMFVISFKNDPLLYRRNVCEASFLENIESALLLVVGPLSTDPEGRKFPGLDSNPGGPSFRRKESGNAKWGCGTRVTLGSYPDGRKTNPGEGCQQ